MMIWWEQDARQVLGESLVALLLLIRIDFNPSLDE